MLPLRIKLKQIRNSTLLVTALVLVGGISYYFGGKDALQSKQTKPSEYKVVNTNQPGDYKNVDFSLFWQVWGELEKAYIDPTKINPEKMVYGAISGMTSSLGDDYTVFLPPSENKQNNENLSGLFYGVGIQVGYKDRQLAVIAPLEGMAAERAGVESGDWILNIKDEIKGIDRDTQGITLPEAVSLIRGERGTSVRLKLFRENVEEPFEVDIVREEVIIPSVDLELIPLENDQAETGAVVAHLKVMQFGDRTSDEWDKAVEELLTSKATLMGVILDLRNNPGGFLKGSVDLASEFITDGTVVVQRGRAKSDTFSAKGRARFSGIPLIVVINEGSASASEILAGALRDRIGVKLVGEKTFGKGTVQEAKNLNGGAGLHITTSEWVLPSGEKINGKGLEPDFVVENVEDELEIDEQLEKAKEILLTLK